jgi:alpha-ketoglutarate-dependent taurine dioxygenase
MSARAQQALKRTANLANHLATCQASSACTTGSLEVTPLAPFGAVVAYTGADIEGLFEPSVARRLRALWREHGGLLVIERLRDLTAEQFAALSGIFGEVETELDVSKKAFAVAGIGVSDGVGPAVMRLGNLRDDAGRSRALWSIDKKLPPDGSPTYRPQDRSPVWHTDSTYRSDPPIGSLLHCRLAPACGGGATCFADTAAAYAALPPAEQRRAEGLECVCSLAHHDSKVLRDSPTALYHCWCWCWWCWWCWWYW